MKTIFFSLVFLLIAMGVHGFVCAMQNASADFYKLPETIMGWALFTVYYGLAIVAGIQASRDS